MLKPIPTDNLDANNPEDVEMLTRHTRNEMLRALEVLTKSKKGQQAFLAVPPKAEPEKFIGRGDLPSREQEEDEAANVGSNGTRQRRGAP